jgi:rare lipoprotein A
MRPLVLAALIVIAGCSSSPRFTRGEPSARSSNGGDGASRPAAPASKPGVLLTLEGVASYYADDFHGKLAANGERFDMNALTAAHRTFPFGTEVRVTNLANAKSVVVRINDRGPFKEGRLIDLSLRAAKDLDMMGTGTAKVRLEVLRWGDGTLHHRN